MPTSTDVGILRRLVVMTVLLAAGYLVIWRGSYALFAPSRKSFVP